MSFDLSIGIIHALYKFCRSEISTGVSFEDLHHLEISFAGEIDIDLVLQYAQQLNFLACDINGYLKVTDLGSEFISFETPDDYIRFVVFTYVRRFQPKWVIPVTKGRDEFKKYIGEDFASILQIFEDAGLYKEPTNSVVEWWDRLQGLVRGFDNSKNETGRLGEKLTLAYELRRLKFLPTWKAIDSNFAGYDILSWDSPSKNHHISIEAKCTRSSPKTVRFYISKNEWRVATSSQNYYFYLWAVKEDDCYLEIVDKTNIADHMPIENGEGEWDSSTVPYKLFLNFTKAQKFKISELLSTLK